MNDKPQVAFLGLGIMGAGMAARLVSQGFSVTTYNRSAGKAEKIGAPSASTPKQAATGAKIVVSMLSDDDAARRVWLDENGALAGAAPGIILIECSTVTVDWINQLQAAAAKQDCELLDAPVTGSKNHAAAGELAFLVGGKAPTLEAARPVLAAMSKEIIHIGPSGSGARMKLINNFVCGVQAVALADAIAMIEHAGMDRDKAISVLANGAPGSPLVKLISARMKANDFTPNFRLKLMAKDLHYALQHTEMAVARAALRSFEKAIEAGLGEEDFSAVVEVARKKEKA